VAIGWRSNPIREGDRKGRHLVGALVLSRVGIVALVAQGSATMGYLLITLFAIPLLTVGVIRIRNPNWGTGFLGPTGWPRHRAVRRLRRRRTF
jgi:hypothetical protein